MKIEREFKVKVSYSDRGACGNFQEVTEGYVRRIVETMNIDNLRVEVTLAKEERKVS